MAVLSKKLSILRQSGPTMSRVAIGGAWLFLIVSLLHLLWVCVVKWSDPSGLTTLYQTTVDGETHRIALLTYDGWPGLVLAMFEGAAVIAAAVMSTLPFRRPRRIGHLTLLAWVATWTIGLVYLAMLDPGDLTGYGPAIAMVIFAGCSIWRWRASERRWGGKRNAKRPSVGDCRGPSERDDGHGGPASDGDSIENAGRAKRVVIALPVRMAGRCCRTVVRSVRSRRSNTEPGGQTGAHSA